MRLSFNGIWWSGYDTAGRAGWVVENGSQRNWTLDIEKEQGKSKRVKGKN